MCMNSKGVFLLILSIGVVLADNEIENVKDLTEQNFDEFIRTYDYVLVKFYAPWCGHCKAMAPAFEAAGQIFRSTTSDVRFAKVDATVQSSLAAKYEVQGYPTLLFFKNGVPRKYNGGRDEDGLVKWVKSKQGPAVIEIDHQDVFDTHFKKGVMVIGLFEKTNEIFEKLAEENEGKVFAILTSEALIKSLELSGKNGIIVMSKDEVNVLPEADITTELEASKFIQAHSLQLVNEFTEQAASKLFGGPINQYLFLLGSKSHELFGKIYEEVEEVARENRRKLLFVFISSENEDNSRIYEFIGVPLDTPPTVRILDLADSPRKYKPDENQSIFDFVSAYNENRATRDLKTESLPAQWNDGNIKYLVGSNFDSYLSSSTGFVFVKFYAPWCGHCKQLAPIWEEAAGKFVGNDKIVFAKLDSTANDLDSITITSFPTLKIFKNGQEVETYTGERTLADIEKFVNKHIDPTSSGETPSEEEKSEETDDKVHEEL